MYVKPNVRSKKELKERLAAGEKIEVYSPGIFPAKADGKEYVEGPHYPEPHSWYAAVEVAGGFAIRVLK